MNWNIAHVMWSSLIIAIHPCGFATFLCTDLNVGPLVFSSWDTLGDLEELDSNNKIEDNSVIKQSKYVYIINQCMFVSWRENTLVDSDRTQQKKTLKTRWPEARALRCFLSSIWNQRNCTRYTFLHLVDTVNYGHEIELSSFVTIYSGWKPILGCHHLTTGETIMALLICSMLRGCWLLKPTCPPAITNAVTENNHFILPCSFPPLGTAAQTAQHWTLSRWYKQNSVMNLWSSKQEQNLKSRWLYNSECVRHNPVSPRFSKIQGRYILSYRFVWGTKWHNMHNQS